MAAANDQIATLPEWQDGRMDAQFGPHRFSAGDGGGSTEFRAARFDVADLRGARFTDCDLTGVTIRDGWLVDVTISGYLSNVTVNDIDVAGFVSAELDRRHPERRQFPEGQDPPHFPTTWATTHPPSSVAPPPPPPLPPPP